MTERIVAVLLASMSAVGCSPTLDVGATTAGGFVPTGPDASTVQGSVDLTDVTAPDAVVGFTESLMAYSVEIVGNQVSLIARGPADQFSEMDQFSLSLWSNNTGSFRCEDPDTAQRTRITFYSPGLSGLLLSTVSPHGQCLITVTRYPTIDDPAYEGTFSATFPDWPVPPNKIKANLTGSFSISGVTSWISAGL